VIKHVEARFNTIGRYPREESRQRERKTLPVEVVGLIYFVSLLVLGVVLVWQPAEMARMTEEIGRLEAKLQDLKMRNEDLKKTLAEVESLGYIEKMARDKLGMVAPDEVKTLAFVETASHVETPNKGESASIFSLLDRIAQIFGAKGATAKGQR